MVGCLLYVVQLVVNLIGSTKLLNLPQGKGGAEGGGGGVGQTCLI